MVVAMKQPDRTLFNGLEQFMVAHGFKFINSRGVYVRKRPDGFDDFSWSSYPLTTGEKWEAGYYEGGYGLGLRSDAIEVLTREVMPVYGADNQRYAFTIYRSVGSPNVHFPFDVSRDQALCLRFDHLEADVADAIHRIKSMLESDGFAWFERYADPAALSRDLNDPLDLLAGPHPLMNNRGQRPLVGIAAACVGEPQRVGDLIYTYLTQAQEFDVREGGGRNESFASKLEEQLGMIVTKARKLGYEVAEL